MQIRTFRADSLQDALEEIRQQMGPDASVLHTRQVRDGWMGWLGRTYVEVTAGFPPNGETNGAAPTGPVTPITITEKTLRTDARNPNERSRRLEHPVAHRGLHLPAETSIELPAQLLAYRDALLSVGVRTETASRWIQATHSFAANLNHSVDHSVSQPWLEHLQRSVAREIRLGGPIRIPPGSRHIVALVGPTGVGKTTTVAKLAAGFRIESKRRVGLLTIDTFRIAAVQQLKAYAEIMDLPMQVVERASEMRPALETLGDVDLILIDTAGRSPRSDARIDQLAELLRSAQPDETHLVMSATTSTASIHSVIEGFAPARPTAAIITKLDEAPHTAGVLSAITATNVFAGMPISYLTHGQQVPDDISVADAETLLSRLLPAHAAAAISHLDAA